MIKKNIVVVGAGKGLGNAVAKIFGKNDFRVILVSRNLERLKGYKTEFEKDNIETYVYSADCENPQTLESTFNEKNKAKQREEQFPKDLQNAYELGQKLLKQEI